MFSGAVHNRFELEGWVAPSDKHQRIVMGVSDDARTAAMRKEGYELAMSGGIDVSEDNDTAFDEMEVFRRKFTDALAKKVEEAQV